MSNSACLKGRTVVHDNPFGDEGVQFLDLEVERSCPPRWQHFSDHGIAEFFRQHVVQEFVIQGIRERLHAIPTKAAGT